MQQSLGQTLSSACCSPMKPGRIVLRADALTLSAWLVQGLEGKCGLVVCWCPSALAAAWLEMPVRWAGIAACACFPPLTSLTLLSNLLELGWGCVPAHAALLPPVAILRSRCRISAWLQRSPPLPSMALRCRAVSRCSAGNGSTTRGTRACQSHTTSILSP